MNWIDHENNIAAECDNQKLNSWKEMQDIGCSSSSDEYDDSSSDEYGSSCS
jgi:hypothetical protein